MTAHVPPKFMPCGSCGRADALVRLDAPGAVGVQACRRCDAVDRWPKQVQKTA